MPYWSTDTLRARIPTDGLVEPYDEGRVIHSAYELGVGGEAFVTSSASDKTQVPPGAKIVLPPGQFGLVATRETIRVPNNAIAFISIRAGIKFQGLINVSGFHVDPGYKGKLKFAVYNAGSRPIVLDQEQRVFMIWFADLDKQDSYPYPDRAHPHFAITADDVSRIQGDVASPAMLRKQLEELKIEVDKKFHTTEQTRLFNRALIMLLLGVTVSIALGLLRPYFEKGSPSGQTQAPPTPNPTQVKAPNRSG